MRERVLTFRGINPIILVAPHGASDINTAKLTELTAKLCSGYAVINQGFERSSYVDVENDLADCNRIDHCTEDVVYEEFLEPLENFVGDVAGDGLENHTVANIFYIHGCGNIVHKEAKNNVGAIVGYGLGKKNDSLSCDLWRKNLFVGLWRYEHLKTGLLGEVYEGKGGGRYAGRDSNNLNQLYISKGIKPYYSQSMQLEFPYSTRTDNQVKNTACTLSNILMNYIKYTEYLEQPTERFI